MALSVAYSLWSLTPCHFRFSNLTSSSESVCALLCVCINFTVYLFTSHSVSLLAFQRMFLQLMTLLGSSFAGHYGCGSDSSAIIDLDQSISDLPLVAAPDVVQLLKICEQDHLLLASFTVGHGWSREWWKKKLQTL
ncbi:hypothetical protein V8G54_031070 [Vigna mungo]|uniref:Uncharacterized protein n=1 Tax=Vigna mungo TaxID=3915 RepID=A0AAQ3MW78_VIGMU